MKKLMNYVMFLPLMLVLTACPEEEKLKGISFDEDAIQVAVGQTYPLTVIPRPSDAEISGVVYESEDENIATISKTGRVRGISEGITYVYATAGNYSAECEVHVIANESGATVTTDIYTEPYPVWDVSIATVKKWEKRELYGEGVTTSGLDGLAYYGGNKNEEWLEYYFDAGKYVVAFLYFSLTDLQQSVQSFLDEKYYFLKIDSGYRMYCTEDEETVLYLGIDDDGYLVAEYWSTEFLISLQESSSARSAKPNLQFLSAPHHVKKTIR